MHFFINLMLTVLIQKRTIQVLIPLVFGCFFLIGQQQVNPIYAQQTGTFRVYLPLVARMEYQTGPDIYSTSYYMRYADPEVSKNMGCALGARDASLPGDQLNLVVLDYGRAIYDQINDQMQYGSRLFTTATRVDMGQIAMSAQNFGLGYYNCTGDDMGSRVIIGIGTNNYEYSGCTNCSVTYEHGRAWASMVNDVNTWLVDKGYSAQASAAGANDIELSWNTYERTKAWLDGYGSVNKYEMLNYGALPGCPYFGAEGARCANGWTKDQAWYVIWGAPPVYPVPEIYLNSGINAQQWYLMSVYAYDAHGLAIEFRGVMTQMQACQQSSGDPTCPQMDNTPAEGWNQLQSLVNGNPKTVHKILYSTDIRWQ